jgi:hypothetical protein
MSKQKILDFFELRDKIEETVRDYVQDTLLPLDDRWEIFEKSGFGDCPCWVQNLKSLHHDILCYDGLVHIDRNQTVSVFYIVERYYEDLQDALENTFSVNKMEEWRKYKFDPVAFKEECLAKFLKGWKYDW